MIIETDDMREVMCERGEKAIAIQYPNGTVKVQNYRASHIYDGCSMETAGELFNKEVYLK